MCRPAAAAWSGWFANSLAVRIDPGPGGQQGAHGLGLAEEGREMERGVAVGRKRRRPCRVLVEALPRRSM